MTTSDMIRELCEKQNISLAELCRRIGQTPQNFNKKLKRGTVSTVELLKIADVLGIVFEQRFIIKGKSSIEITNREVDHE
jgi:transcriptional regulator with XRE-family HTH domain